MSTTAEPDETAVVKKSKLPLILGFVLAVAGGAGGFFAVKSGVIPRASAADDDHLESVDPAHAPKVEFAFVPLDPIIVTLPLSDHGSLLRFSAQLEVNPDYEADVTALKPRVIDVLNGYLRAVKPEDLTDPTALARLRSQMLRRVQIVAGEGKVTDVLIMEFVVN